MLRWRNIFVVLFLCIFSLSGVNLAFGQTWNLPDNRKNTRITSDQFNIPRPALSMRGFDNTKNDNYQHQYSSTTYGVRQVLENAYGIGQTQDAVVASVLDEILGQASVTNLKSFTNGNAEHNSSVLESMAFIALISYIIEENASIFDGIETEFNMPTHANALNDFISTLRGRGNYIRDVSKNNAFKRSTSLMKVARAWDLYLALENAYEDLGGNLSLLLNASDKQWWNDTIYDGLKTLWQDSNGNLPLIGEWDGWSGGVQLHEVQAGNWPLISFVAAGYVALGFNGHFSSVTDDDGVEYHDLNSILARGMKSTAFHYTDTGDKRYNYWWYQTGEGKPFWAEGAYYFEIALPKVLQFWHVIRANNMLDFSSHGDGIDPFRYTKFLKPIKWLANISTPDGNTPPFDDGNKKPINSSTLLSWGSAYGDVNTGRKFAFIRDLQEIGGPGSYRDGRLVEIAIPRQSVGNGTAPPANYGNTASTSTWHKQTVVRRNDSDGRLHYIFMNGESGDAITRGEGHEQPDQLQLLYYVDNGVNGETSYLMDTGYDYATGKENSTWNYYYKHNVLGFLNGGLGRGLPSPYRNEGKTRKVSEHDPASNFYYQNNGKVIVLKGQVDLKHYNYIGQLSYWSTNTRKVLFIADPANPYIIDINTNKRPVVAYNAYMNHEGNLKYYSDTEQLTHRWDDWSEFEYSGSSLFMQINPVEWEPEAQYSYSSSSVKVREENNRDLNPSAKDGYFASKIGIVRNLASDNIRDWNAVSFIALSETDLNFSPEPLFSYQSNNKTPYQGWYWKHDATTVDVIVKRSKVDMGWYNTRLEFAINKNGVAIDAIRLPGGEGYGFARFQNVNGEWEVDPDYQINLTQPTLAASVSGPQFVSSGEVKTWTANASYNDGPVSYQWYRRESLNDSWQITSETSSSYTTYFNNLGSTDKQAGVRVDVTSAGESATASKFFNVSPADNCGSYSIAGGDTLQSYDSTGSNSLEDDTVNSDSVGTNIIIPCSSTTQSQAKQRMQDQLLVSKPQSFTVEPNYPNPFNPSTTIKYGLPEQSEVTVNIYNILGQNVATLVNETQTAGRYTARFDAGRLASGLYIARIIAQGVSGEQFVRELKMQLVK